MELFDYLLAKKKGGGSSGDINWSEIGYNFTPNSLVNDFNYAKQIYDNWVSETNLNYKFQDDTKLVYMPLVDTSNATTMISMFQGCAHLTTIPLLDTSKVTRMDNMFSNTSLATIPLLDTSNVTVMDYMFSSCSNLATIPLLDTSNATTMYNMFQSSNKLTDESLNNILQMCINATSYTGTKSLYYLGLRSSSYPVSRIEALPHYQEFINAGWTIGY